MSSGTLDAILRRILRVAERKSAEESDQYLLECFVAKHDEAAFAALMERHGRLVFSVCRSVLNQEQDAEDAFQATFLVLARMASSIHQRDSLASWLHGVALRTALKARQAMNTRRRKERLAETRTPEQPVSTAAFRELQAILHEEVDRLAEKYRAPFALCCLEGKTRVEAAQELGWKEGTVASRVAQARKLLESRLLRRGVALSAALAAATLAPVPARAALSFVVARGAAAFAAGQVPEAVSAEAITLAEGVIKAMFVTKLKLMAGIVLLSALLLIGGGMLAVAASQPDGDGAIAAQQSKEPDALDPEPDMPPAPGNGLETPLPRGALVRFGTTRFRTGAGAGGLKLSLDGKKLLSGGRASGGGVFVWDATTGKRILWRPLGEEGEISRDGERLYLIESLPIPPQKKPPAGAVKIVIGAAAELPEVKNALMIYQLSTGKRLKQISAPSRLCGFAVSADERTLALEYADRNGPPQVGDGSINYEHKSRLELHDLKTGRVLHRLGEQQPRSFYPGSWLRFSQDGKTLFVVGKDSTIKRFDVASGAAKQQTTIAGRPYVVGDKTLIVGSNKIWDLEKERLLWTLQEFGTSKPGRLNSIYSFTPDCRTAVGNVGDIKPVDGTGSSVVLWDLQTNAEIRRLPNHAAYAISADGKTGFATSWTGVNGRWFRWELATGKEVDSIDAPTSPPAQIAFSPDGKYVATADSTSSADKNYDRTKKYFVLRIWDRATGKSVHKTETFLATRLFFTPDGKHLVYSNGLWGNPKSPSGYVNRFFSLDTATWKETTRDFDERGNVGIGMDDCRLSPDGKILAAHSQSKPWVDVWDWTSGKLIGKLEPKQLGAGPIAFSADSKQLTCFSPSHERVQVWDLVDRKLLSDKSLSDPLKGTNPSFHLIADGKLVAGGWLPPRGPWRGMLRFPEHMDDPIPADLPASMPPMPDALVAVWDAATGKEKVRFKYPQNENMSEMPALFSPDGKLVVTANWNAEIVYFRDLTNGAELGQFRCGTNGVHSMAFSPDCQTLAISAKDTTVVLVDVRKVLNKK